VFPVESQGRFIPSKQAIGIGLLKGKCNSKRAGKRFLKIIVRQKKGTFSAKKWCVNVQKVMPGGKTEKELVM